MCFTISVDSETTEIKWYRENFEDLCVIQQDKFIKEEKHGKLRKMIVKDGVRGDQQINEVNALVDNDLKGTSFVTFRPIVTSIELESVEGEENLYNFKYKVVFLKCRVYREHPFLGSKISFEIFLGS